MIRHCYFSLIFCHVTCLESSSLHKLYRVMNFLASSLASKKPSATNMISQINSKSGTTIAHGLEIKMQKSQKRDTKCRKKCFHMIWYNIL